jgi:PIN domain nuclease of toxin-antitoxin system
MRILLDTHVFLWSVGGSPLLKPNVRRIIEEAESVHVSAASI